MKQFPVKTITLTNEKLKVAFCFYNALPYPTMADQQITCSLFTNFQQFFINLILLGFKANYCSEIVKENPTKIIRSFVFTPVDSW